MSAYGDDYDEPRRYRSVRTRVRDRDDPDYIREETYIERGKAVRGNEMVFRGRDSDSIEDIPRHFPPPGRDYRRSSYREFDDRRTRSAGGRRYEEDYDDDRYTDYAVPAAAGAAGYAQGRRHERDRRSRRDDRSYYSDESVSPPPRERRKSGVEDMLASLGLGGVAGAILGKDKDKSRDRDRSDSRDRRSTRSRSRARSRRGHSDDEDGRSRHGGKDQTEKKWAQAAQAALLAGAVEAFRSRKEPGPWTADKGKRIATAAIGAGGFDKMLDRNPDEKSKRHLAEAVIGGLAVNRLANGPRSKSRARDAREFDLDGRPRSRSRSIIDRFRGRDARDFSPDAAPRSRSRSIIDRFRGRSQSRGRARSPGEESNKGGNAVKGLVAGGALAAGAKAIYDRVRSKSRKRRSPSNSSADSYVPSRNRRRDKRRSPRSDSGSTRRTDGATDRALGPATNQGNPAAGAVAGAGAGAAAGGAIGSHDKNKSGANESGSDSSSTTGMEDKRKKMRGKELITAGLATIATIHAAHGVYSSMEAHEKRHRLVAEGEMSPEEARKKQTKAWIQDAAAVGIAALGIKGAFSEWKEMNEQRREIHEIEKRKRERRKKLLARQKQEERDRHERLMGIMERNPQVAMTYQMMNQGGFPGMPPPGGGANSPMGVMSPTPAAVDMSGNPYAR